MEDKSARARHCRRRFGQAHRGDTEAGEKLIDKAKQIDPKAVEELAEEVKRDKQNSERFVNKG